MEQFWANNLWSAQRQNPHGEPPRHSPQQGTGLDGKHFTSSSGTRASPAARSPRPLGTPQPPHGAFSNTPQGPKALAFLSVPPAQRPSLAGLGQPGAESSSLGCFYSLPLLPRAKLGMPVGYLHTGKQCTQGEAKKCGLLLENFVWIQSQCMRCTVVCGLVLNVYNSHSDQLANDGCKQGDDDLEWPLAFNVGTVRGVDFGDSFGSHGGFLPLIQTWPCGVFIPKWQGPCRVLGAIKPKTCHQHLLPTFFVHTPWPL